MINIQGLDKAALLAALYNNAKVQGTSPLDDDQMNIHEARKLLEKKQYFNSINGRVLEVDLSRDQFDPSLYNSVNGENAAEKITVLTRFTGAIVTKVNYPYNDDVSGRMYVYESEMKAANLSSIAIKEFAYALKRGDLNYIQSTFIHLDDQQKLGLINLFIDFRDFSYDFMSLHAPMGFPIDLAKRFGHDEISRYLSDEMQKIKSAPAKSDRTSLATSVQRHGVFPSPDDSTSQTPPNKDPEEKNSNTAAP